MSKAGSRKRERPEPDWPDYLRALMREKRYASLSDFARALDINVSNVSRWLNHGVKPNPDQLRRMHSRLGIPMPDLYVYAGYVTREELGLKVEPPPEELTKVEPGADIDAIIRYVESMDGLSDGTRRIALATLEQAKREAQESAGVPPSENRGRQTGS